MNELAITDSGVRRIKRTWLAWLRGIKKWAIDTFIPMAPRKHRDHEETETVPDKSQMAWRSFQTALMGYLVYLLTGGSPMADRQLDRLDHRLSSLEEKVDRIDSQLRAISDFRDGFRESRPAVRK